MIAQATARFVRISPRKVRYVIDPIRKKGVPEAWALLGGSPRRARVLVLKLLNQAVDAAEKNHRANPRDLFISKITADGGPTMKRHRAMSMGRAGMIHKRTSHIHIELDEVKRKSAAAPSGDVRKAAKAPAVPAKKKTAGARG
ncbi:MAG: 50S ribosomal protein L22 [Candidatus Omnitrophica bacterium]|nr:50S ribosomal protein L22 [Candidatus Omnitrophota bacterium]